MRLCSGQTQPANPPDFRFNPSDVPEDKVVAVHAKLSALFRKTTTKPSWLDYDLAMSAKRVQDLEEAEIARELAEAEAKTKAKTGDTSGASATAPAAEMSDKGPPPAALAPAPGTAAPGDGTGGPAPAPDKETAATAPEDDWVIGDIVRLKSKQRDYSGCLAQIENITKACLMVRLMEGSKEGRTHKAGLKMVTMVQPSVLREAASSENVQNVSAASAKAPAPATAFDSTAQVQALYSNSELVQDDDESSMSASDTGKCE